MSKKPENPRDVKITIVYDYEKDDVRILSEFENPNDTVKLIQIGLEVFLNSIQSLNCASCGQEVHPSWLHCTNCGSDL